MIANYPGTTIQWHPDQVVLVMRGQINNLRYIVGVHFAKRHNQGNKAVRNWIAELRRVDANSGYSIAIKQLLEVTQCA